MISQGIVAVLALVFGLFLYYQGHNFPQLRTTWFRTSTHSAAQADLLERMGVPPPNPLPNFDVDAARPRPYRPFRWTYHQTMSLSPMQPDWWIEVESTYRQRVAERQKLYKLHGKAVLDSMPGSEFACKELVDMVIQFLCRRYPHHFLFEESGLLFHNRILGTSSDMATVNPLEFLLNHVPEDFLITQEDEVTGLYYLRAGVSCSAVGWNMATKMGMPLHEIHGPVPYYKDKLKPSMDRYFTKMLCNKPIQRGSWGLEIGRPLYLQSDDPHFALRETQSPDLEIADIFLRVDWQTLRRLPESRAIVFNFKALFTPVADFRSEPYIPRLLAKILREGPNQIKEYKGTYHVEHKVLPALDLWAKEQEDKGWVPKEWKERTLDEHPFFPGWESQL